MGARPALNDTHVGKRLWKWFNESGPATAPVPAITRTEIAQWYANQLAPQIEGCLEALGRPGILVIRCREHSFHEDLRDGLSTVLAQTLACDVVHHLPSDADALRQVSSETVDAVNAGRTCIFVVAHERRVVDELPVVDGVFAVPRFDPSSLAQACQTFYELPHPPSVPPSAPWIAQVGPLDLLISSDARGDPIPAIQATTMQRLHQHECSDAAPLESLLGLNEVRTWAANLIEDINDALDPQIRCNWSDVERAVVFAGPPGVGRASLSRAIAQATGLRWMRASARRWTRALDSEPFQSRSERRASLCAIEEDFDAARSISPAILFIDDLGSLHPDLAFELGQEVAKHDDQEPLLVIASCTDEDLPSDQVLKRAGFEHTLYIPLPSAQVLSRKLHQRFQGIPHSLTEPQMLQAGRLALGGTAADLDLYIRRAQKISRREGNLQIAFDDLASAILQTPEVHARPKVSDRDLEETAFHEAGHAVMQFLEVNEGLQLQFVTIVPRRLAGGMTLGFVMGQKEEDRVSMSRAEALALIRSSLGGLAAEELLRGRENRSTGAFSDLESATRLATHLIGRCGLGDRGSLVSRSSNLASDPQLLREVDRLLRRQYRCTVALLRKNWSVVEALAKQLLIQQELSGDEARSVMRAALLAR